MSSNYGISALDKWLGVTECQNSVTDSAHGGNPLHTIALRGFRGRYFVPLLQSKKDFSLRGKFNIKIEYKENAVSLCNSVTEDNAGRIVPSDEVLASADLARQRNRRDRDLIALMYPSNVCEWTWLESSDGRWSAHHSIIFEEAQ